MSDLALHFFEKMKIMVVKDIEREDIEFICKVKTLIYQNSNKNETYLRIHVKLMSNHCTLNLLYL